MASNESESNSYPASYEALYVEKGSRIELFVRIAYGFILSLIANLWMIAVAFALIIQWFHILFLGKKNERLWQFTLSFYRFYARALAYFSLLTDARPPISGNPMPLPWVSQLPEVLPSTAKEYEFCLECGTRLPLGAVYCKKCGRKLH